MFTKAKEYAPMVVRYGLGIVFLLIGLSQWMTPATWVSWFPNFLSAYTGAESFFFYTGIMNTILGILLIVGFLTRIAAALATLHMIGVVSVIGYNDIAMRDYGLILMGVAIFLNGADNWCVDRKIFRNRFFN